MTTKAVVYVEKGKAAIQEVPIPKLRDDYILVKVNAIGVNPTDWKHIDFALAEAGSRIGCDYAGIVKQSAIKIPDNVNDEEAATLGISTVTVGQGLYRTLGLPLPTEATKDRQYILIYGGSTATGIFGIQFAKLSGLKVVTTASPRNFDYLKSLGAEAVFNYNSPTVAGDIRNTEAGKYAVINPVDKEELVAINPNINGPHATLMYSIFGERFFKGMEFPPVPEEFEFAKTFWEIARQLLKQGKLKVPRTIVNKGGNGFVGIIKGLDKLRANNVSARKLVYTL
ncbi:GroES-like protein [Xylaria sp. FL1042]|nr:GroES-like protein [Xylaria sp. FL1042]